jgi:dUTP pyrophosphatase
MEAGDFKLIPLGVALKVHTPGYEIHVVPRSSAYKNWKIVLANSQGIIDETYCGDDDQIMFPAIAFEDTFIPPNTCICQFCI